MKKKQRKQKLTHRQRQDQRYAVPSRVTENAPSPNTQTEGIQAYLSVDTGEIFQPVRLYYRVAKSSQIVDRFLHLACMQFHPTYERWVWLLTGEATALPFQHPTPSMNDAPVALGAWRVMKRMMVLDVFSCERALQAIPFFETYLPRKSAKLSHIGVINRLFAPDEFTEFHFDTSFRNDLQFHDQSFWMLAKILWISLRTRNVHKRLALLEKSFHKQMHQSFPEVEYLPIRYYQEGVAALQYQLTVRQNVAIHQWNGETEYSSHDYIEEVVQQYTTQHISSAKEGDNAHV